MLLHGDSLGFFPRAGVEGKLWGRSLATSTALAAENEQPLLGIYLVVVVCGGEGLTILLVRELQIY